MGKFHPVALTRRIVGGHHVSLSTILSIVALSGVAGGLQAVLLLVLVRLAVAGAAIAAPELPVLNFELTATQGSLFGLTLIIVILCVEVGASHLVARSAAKAYTEVQQRIVSAFLQARWEVQSVDKEGHFHELLTSQAQRVGTAVVSYTAGVSAMVSFVVLALAAFVADFWAALLAVMAVTILLAVSRVLTRSARRQSVVQTDNNLALGEAATETVAHAGEIRLFDVGPMITARFSDLIERSSASQYWSRFLFRLAPVLFRAGAAGIAFLTILVVARLAGGRLDSVGAAVLILLRALNYAQGAQAAYHQLGEAGPWIDSLERQVAAYEAGRDTSGSVPIDDFNRLDVDGVAFSYRNADRSALSNLSFSIRRGEAVGVVGPSGSGKTSLIQLLLAMVQPSVGAIRVDDVPLTDLDRSDWRRLVAFVPQESRISRGTVKEAIRFYRPGFSDAEVEAAARAAGVDAFVRELPRGYDTLIGPRSVGFSGGQRQRIAIARALLGRPKMLILDEPTSALDRDSEAAVLETLAQLRGLVTLVIVSHRPEPLALCDRTLVLHQGRLVKQQGELTVERTSRE